MQVGSDVPSFIDGLACTAQREASLQFHFCHVVSAKNSLFNLWYLTSDRCHLPAWRITHRVADVGTGAFSLTKPSKGTKSTCTWTQETKWYLQVKTHSQRNRENSNAKAKSLNVRSRLPESRVILQVSASNAKSKRTYIFDFAYWKIPDLRWALVQNQNPGSALWSCALPLVPRDLQLFRQDLMFFIFWANRRNSLNIRLFSGEIN